MWSPSFSSKRHFVPHALFFSECQLEAIADGNCQDEVNVPECGFDGGDCCLTNVVTDYCQECHCHLVTGIPDLPCA